MIYLFHLSLDSTNKSIFVAKIGTNLIIRRNVSTLVPGIDLLISKFYSNAIKNHLKSPILEKLERNLFFQHGMSIKLAIENFDIFHSELKNHYKNGVRELEKICFDEIFDFQKSGPKYLLTIKNKELTEKIFNYFGDSENRRILSSLMENKLTVTEILSVSKVLKSPAYRKLENLLLDGLIWESGKILTNNKRVSQYSCIFDEVRITVNNNNLVVKCIINKKIFEKSTTYKSSLIQY